MPCKKENGLKLPNSNSANEGYFNAAEAKANQNKGSNTVGDNGVVFALLVLPAQKAV